MGIFDFFMGNDINKGYEEYKNTKNAVLLDVREKDEFVSGHLKEAKNLPMNSLDKIESIAKDKSAPIFIYCHSGARAGQAQRLLNHMGYPNAKNIGGIMSYNGELKR